MHLSFGAPSASARGAWAQRTLSSHPGSALGTAFSPNFFQPVIEIDLGSWAGRCICASSARRPDFTLVQVVPASGPHLFPQPQPPTQKTQEMRGGIINLNGTRFPAFSGAHQPIEMNGLLCLLKLWLREPQ